MRAGGRLRLGACCALVLAAVLACGSDDVTSPPFVAVPPDDGLTAEEREVWAPLPPDRTAIPVLLYHGIGPATGFRDPTDAAYGVDRDSFDKQLTMIKHAGYRTVDLRTFLDFVQGRPVSLPPRPLLLTFDDARADSRTGADPTLRRLGFTAVMFVDVGAVERGDPEYATWPELAEMQESGLWELELHAGTGHHRIRYGPEASDRGPYYAFERRGESLAAWRSRVRRDIAWGEARLAAHVPGYRPRAFAPPFGAYGQQGTNDPRIPVELLAWLSARYGAVFTQDVDARARPGQRSPFGRLQITRATSGGQIKQLLLTGESTTTPGAG